MNRGTGIGTRASGLLTIVLVALLLTGSGVATAGVMADGDDRSQPAEPDSGSAFVVALEDGGDATVTVDIAFDLTDEANRAAFEALKRNETKRSQLEARTERRLRTVAASAANETGREMTIEDVRVSFETDEDADRGIVSVSATWTELAATGDGRLTVTEPFASGFTADRPVVLDLPDGYSLGEATPAPTTRTDSRVVWNGSTSLEGYEAVVRADESDTDGGDGQTGGNDGQPGFGLGATAVTVAGVAWLHRRR